MNLDRLIAKHQHMGRTTARRAILDGRVAIDGTVAIDRDTEVNRFNAVTLDDDVVQTAARRLRIMLHKPVGVISATKDDRHRTVIDLIDDPDMASLHLVGRLDINSSGLVLLTNDGSWSKPLMHPDRHVPKVYHVTTQQTIPGDATARFTEGFYFATEGITTRSAQLKILSPTTARVTLHEGRYRQIRRMFHRVGCRVTALHRERIGDYHLPDNLLPGEWRHLVP